MNFADWFLIDLAIITWSIAIWFLAYTFGYRDAMKFATEQVSKLREGKL